jgi:hypothetical protein
MRNAASPVVMKAAASSQDSPAGLATGWSSSANSPSTGLTPTARTRILTWPGSGCGVCDSVRDSTPGPPYRE